MGHPLLEHILNFKETGYSVSKSKFVEKYGLEVEKPIISLLPGSRKQEIEKKLPSNASCCF